MSDNGAPKDDQVAQAIAATDQPARQFTATIASTGRVAAIVLPADATDGEIAEFCGWVLGPVLATFRAERAKSAASRLVVPRPGVIARA